MSARPRHLLPVLLLVGILLAASIPYLYGYAVRPSGTLFWAIPWINYSDANQYLALTRQVADGRLLVGDPFTQQPHAPRLFLPLVLAEGGICRLFHVSPLIAFQVSRVGCGTALLTAAYWFGTLFLPKLRERTLFVAFLGLTAGASWYVEQLRLPWSSGDLLQPEGNTLFTLANLPHLSLASALLTALFASLAAMESERHSVVEFRTGSQPHGPWLLLAVGSAFLLAWTHPFDLVTYALGAGTYALICLLRDRRLPLTTIQHMGAVFLGAAPAALYLVWLVRSDPVYRALASDISQVNELRFYLLAHGFLVVPSLVLFFSAETRRRYLLPLCWATCAFLFLLTPFRMGGKQARLLGGVHVPLALLATAGLESAARRGLRRSPEAVQSAGVIAAGSAFLVLTAPSALGMLQRQSHQYALRSPGFYLSPQVQELFRYLDRNGDRSQLTMGGAYTGGWAPVLADTRAYHGHWHMTLNEGQKRAQRDWFFLENVDPLRKEAWLRENGIDWVIYYPWEWQRTPAPLDTVPGLRRVYETPEIRLYRFVN